MATPIKTVSGNTVYLDDVVLNSRLVAIVPNISLFGKVFSCVAVCHDESQRRICLPPYSCAIQLSRSVGNDNYGETTLPFDLWFDLLIPLTHSLRYSLDFKGKSLTACDDSFSSSPLSQGSSFDLGRLYSQDKERVVLSTSLLINIAF